ncbi:MAG: helix-hairpin-helix domain-containing protein [Thermoplasmata archaeon]
MLELDDFKRQYEMERERLAKLWDAYEIQERELQQDKEKITKINEIAADKDRIIISLKHVLETRDAELRNAQVELNKLKREREEYQPKAEELQRLYREEKDKLSKLFILAQELDTNLSAAKQDILVRDEWFKTHVEAFRGAQRVVESYDRMMRESRERREARPLIREDIKRIVETKTKPIDTVIETKGTIPKSEVATQITSSEPMTRESFIDLLTTVPSLGRSKAEAIYNAGYTGLAKIRQATPKELSEAKGVSIDLARKIKRQFR